ncbi:MAG: lysophospholipid acyltransferase family protein [Saccharofermentanales bacterium]
MKPEYSRKKRHFIFGLLKTVIRLFFRHQEIIGLDNVNKAAPGVFICNHDESYAPIVMELFFPLKFRPWVIYNNFYFKLCAEYLEKDFITTELKLRRPLSRWLSLIIAPFCILVMRAVEGIPVYRGMKDIRETFSLSVDAVEQGFNLMIFPENRRKKFSDYINDFDEGFIHLAKSYKVRTGKTLDFYPVYADKKKRSITIGKPVSFSSINEYNRGKRNVVTYLRDSINEIAIMNRG